jgi:hypothetical protein
MIKAGLGLYLIAPNLTNKTPTKIHFLNPPFISPEAIIPLNKGEKNGKNSKPYKSKSSGMFPCDR